MYREIKFRKEKLISLVVAMVFVCGLFSLQALAVETDDVTLPTITVAFDPDDDVATYKDFFKVTVHVGDLVTEKPADPVRDGYFFQGWYSHLDGDGAPVFWDFEKDTVIENTTLWAVWEEGCIVAFDPDDDIATYKDFFKVTVHVGDLVTEKPADSVRDGYFFQGWYSHLDGNGAPVFWDFEKNTVIENTTLWAAWAKKSTGGGNHGGGNPGTTTPETTDPDEGQSGEDNGSGGEEELTIDDGEVPTGSSSPDDDTSTGSGSSDGGILDKTAKTGDSSLSAMVYGALALMSLSFLGLCLLKRKKMV
jgi:LPXTG-motif cell wall-anchored protein